MARRTAARTVEQTALAIVLLMALLVVVIPLGWLVLTAVKYERDLFTSNPVIIPDELTWEHFRAVLSDQRYVKYIGNTVVVALSSTLLSTLFGALAAYSLTRLKLPLNLNNILAMWFLVTRMYPAIATALPYFLLMRTFGLLDTRLGLILTYTGFNLGLVIWLMLGFFREIPVELEQAAMVDGASTLQAFFRIVVPVSTPGLVTTAIFSFILAWNEFLFAVILTSENAKTLPVAISGFITDKGLAWGEMSALSLISALPVVVFALAVQRYLVRGLTFGAVKG